MNAVDETIELYERWGPDPYDEEISQLAHALQAAALATATGADDALVAAALLHDVGHLLALRDGEGTTERRGGARHDAVGASWLEPRFGRVVAAPVALHVAAKRYLCAVEPAYHGSLSPGSVRSLAGQGGSMTEPEVANFESTSGWQDAVRLRRWDDAGKVEGLDVAALDHFRDLLAALARTTAG